MEIFSHFYPHLLHPSWENERFILSLQKLENTSDQNSKPRKKRIALFSQPWLNPVYHRNFEGNHLFRRKCSRLACAILGARLPYLHKRLSILQRPLPIYSSNYIRLGSICEVPPIRTCAVATTQLLTAYQSDLLNLRPVLRESILSSILQKNNTVAGRYKYSSLPPCPTPFLVNSSFPLRSDMPGSKLWPLPPKQELCEPVSEPH